MIYVIGGVPVILDTDLAMLYGCKNGTKEINQAVKNNIEKFPKSYSWVLSEEELQILRSKILTFDDLKKIDNRKYKIRFFTESGTWMLSTILKTPIASQVTMMIIDAFVSMRKFISTTLIEQKNINNQVLLNTQNIDKNMQYIDDVKKNLNKNIEDIKLIKDIVCKFDNNRNNSAIFFAGQIFDAYSKIVDIMRDAKGELIIVDAYADKDVLDIISKLEVNVILIIKSHGNLSNLVIDKEQYGNLKVVRINTIHDRFIILDRRIVYHCGASIRHAGRNTFAINIMEDETLKNTLLNWLNNIIIEQEVNDEESDEV